MKNKNVYFGFIVFLILAALIFASYVYVSRDKGSWSCVGGEWVATGSPKSAMPTSACPSENTQTQNQVTSTSTLQGETVSLVISPKQCETEPWQKWYQDGGIQFIKAPTDEQLIKAYYSNKYNIQILSADKAQVDGVTCQACHVCAKGYVFTIEVDQKDAGTLVGLGWENVGEK